MFTHEALELIRDVFADPESFWPAVHDLVEEIHDEAVNQLGE